jgi:hypothetical protein
VNKWYELTDESNPPLTGKLLLVVVYGVKLLAKRVYNQETKQCYFEDYVSGTRIKQEAIEFWCYTLDTPTKKGTVNVSNQ